MSLSTRIAVVICSLVLFTAVVSSSLIYWRFNSQLVASKLDYMESESEIQSTRFLGRIDELMRDARFISGTPPVQGMIRALENNGIDPLDGSRLEIWEQRLGVIFREMLISKPDYLQIRYIGLANNGLELVRAERHRETGIVRVVPNDELQSKGSRDYFQKTIEAGRASVYLSPIELNREWGELQEPYVPVLRASMPVLNQYEEAFGIVIINLNMTSIFNELIRVSNTSHQYYLVNEQGYFLRSPNPGHEFGFEFGRAASARIEFPELENMSTDAGKDVVSKVRDVGEVVSARRIKFGPPDSKQILDIIVTDTIDDITAISRQVYRQIGFVIVLLLLVGLLLGLWLTRRVTQPIETLTGSIQHMNINEVHWDRPTGLQGEAGELSQALGSVFDSLKVRTDELTATNRELNQFAYVASHDLQEPARTISSFTDLIIRQYAEQFDERGKKYLNFISESCERMRTLIHDLLEYSRLGSRSSAERVDLNETLEAIRADMRTTIESSGAVLKIGSMPVLRLYPVEIRLLFQNLISNAIKYVPEGRKPVVEIQSRHEVSGWLFSVMDNGLGIAEEHREKIFLIFQRLHGMGEYEGTGIGLANCAKVAELHRGRIWVEDAADGGAVFNIRIHEVEEK